jgi:hypothetical protein
MRPGPGVSTKHAVAGRSSAKLVGAGEPVLNRSHKPANDVSARMESHVCNMVGVSRSARDRSRDGDGLQGPARRPRRTRRRSSQPSCRGRPDHCMAWTMRNSNRASSTSDAARADAALARPTPSTRPSRRAHWRRLGMEPFVRVVASLSRTSSSSTGATIVRQSRDISRTRNVSAETP